MWLINFPAASPRGINSDDFILFVPPPSRAKARMLEHVDSGLARFQRPAASLRAVGVPEVINSSNELPGPGVVKPDPSP
jgi:hypothetical protein